MAQLRFQSKRTRVWIEIWCADLVHYVCQPEMIASFTSTELEEMLNALSAEHQLRGTEDVICQSNPKKV